MNLELTTGVLGNTRDIENGWMGISCILFFMWVITIWFLNRRIKEIKELKK